MLFFWVLGGIITAFAAAIVLIGAAGWLTLRSSWFEDSLSKVSVTEDADGAERIAEAMGVHLNDSAINYGEVTSQLQGKPSAYLVVKADGAMLRDRIIRQSRLHCATTDPPNMASMRSPSRHGPPRSPTLTACGRPAGDYNDPASAGEWGGHLTVWFDPQAGDRSTWLYISAAPF